MIGTVVAVLVSALLTSAFWKMYVDRLRGELHTDAYAEGWDDGYKVGDREGRENGFREGYEAGDAPKKPAKVVKKAKKITPKGD